MLFFKPAYHIVAICLTSNLSAKSLSKSQLKNIAQDIVYVVEQGNKSYYAKKWKNAPTIAIKSGQNSSLVNFINYKNSELSKLTNLDPSKDCTIEVYIDTKSNLQLIAQKNDLRVNIKDGCCYWTKWNAHGYITKAFLLIPSSGMTESSIKSQISFQLLGCYGFPQRTKLLTSGCFANIHPEETEMTQFDKQFISFYYANIVAGASVTELRKTIDEKW